jgi:hypothetical protein
LSLGNASMIRTSAVERKMLESRRQTEAEQSA